MVKAQQSWVRLEPQPYDATLKHGLSAPVHDPLWMLNRQLRLGELAGSDGGSPARVEVDGTVSRLTRYLPGLPPTEHESMNTGPWQDRPRTAVPYLGDQPLEALIEGVQPGGDPLRIAAATGAQFLRLLDEAGLAVRGPEWCSTYPLQARAGAGSRARMFAGVLTGRCPDGVALARALAAADGALPTQLRPHSDSSAELKVTKDYLIWFQAVFPSEQAPAWNPQRLEYQFAVAGPAPHGAEAVFTAEQYDSGRLDWSSFRLNSDATGIGAANDTHDIQKLPPTGLPTPVVFPAMPNHRFWEFEDAAVDFGDLSAPPDALSELLAIEFAIVYANDHFVVPVDLTVGSFCQIEDMRVIDTFGHPTRIPHISEADVTTPRAARFRIYEPSHGATRTSTFLLPPVLAQSAQGSDVESVRLIRDEGANIAWAVESLVSPAEGFPLSEPAQGGGQDTELPQSAGTGWRYRVQTPVSPRWIPLVPVADRPGQIHFETGTLAGHGNASQDKYLSRIVKEISTIHIPEEEITSGATQVAEAWQYTRWIDGSQHVWLGRRREPVPPTGNSGLRFDLITRK